MSDPPVPIYSHRLLAKSTIMLVVSMAIVRASVVPVSIATSEPLGQDPFFDVFLSAAMAGILSVLLTKKTLVKNVLFLIPVLPIFLAEVSGLVYAMINVPNALASVLLLYGVIWPVLMISLVLFLTNIVWDLGPRRKLFGRFRKPVCLEGMRDRYVRGNMSKPDFEQFLRAEMLKVEISRLKRENSQEVRTVK